MAYQINQVMEIQSLTTGLEVKQVLFIDHKMPEEAGGHILHEARISCTKETANAIAYRCGEVGMPHERREGGISIWA